MLEFSVAEPGPNAVVDLGGRLDAITVDDFDKVIKPVVDEATSLVLDIAGLEYISSAGIRSILITGKMMEGKGGSLTIRNTPESIMQIFDITGIVPVLNLE